MTWSLLDWPRLDEVDWFCRISDGKTVLWMAGATTWLWHATADGRVAVCSPLVAVDRDRDPYPSTRDRSADTMTCDRCSGMTRRTKMPSPLERKHWR